MSAPAIRGAVVSIVLGSASLGWWQVFDLVGGLVLLGAAAIAVVLGAPDGSRRHGGLRRCGRRRREAPAVRPGADRGRGDPARAVRRVRSGRADAVRTAVRRRLPGCSGEDPHPAGGTRLRFRRPGWPRLGWASRACQADLEEARVRAYLGLAAGPGQDATQRLQRAREAATAANRPELIALVDARAPGPGNRAAPPDDRGAEAGEPEAHRRTEEGWCERDGHRRGSW